MLKLSQEMKLTQRLDFRMIQSLKLLPLTTLQLTQRISEELEQNPLLQLDEEVEQEQEQKSPELTTNDSGQVVTSSESESEQKGDFSEAEWLQYMDDGFYNGYRRDQEYDPNIEERESTNKYITTMSDYLLEQLGMASLNDYEKEIGEFIIGSLNDNGFLELPDEDIANDLGVDIQDVRRIVEVIQKFEPTGIGARNLRECLLFQLREKEMEGTLAWDIVDRHIDDFTGRRHKNIMQSLQVSQDKLKEALEIITTLTPRPGAIFSDSTNMAIIPDIIVEKVDDEYVVMLNDRYVPHLTISSHYHKLLNKGAGTSSETRKYLVDRLNSARWFINSIEQRRSTILRVSSELVERQKEFLEHGVSHLKPMTLQDIADSIGVAISTVQRVISGKYIQTPQGVFELKYFFTQRILSSDGSGDLSAKTVKETIRNLIEKENHHKPLSDQKITTILNKQGVVISRRAIAKYRDGLQIPPARLRKQL